MTEIPSSVAERQLLILQAHPEIGLSVRCKVLELFELKGADGLGMFQVALILDELRKTIDEIENGRIFIGRYLNL